jgi:hypothetical protein
MSRTTRKNWDQVAKKQFDSLDEDIRNDWGDLYQLTTSNK